METGMPSGYSPAVEPYQQFYTYPVRVDPGRVRGSVSDFREAAILVGHGGVTIQGRAVLPAAVRALIYLVSVALMVGVLLAALLLEYAIRVSRVAPLPWDCVESVILETGKWRACVVYHLPERPTKPISLAFRLPPATFPHFVQVMEYFAPGKVHEGRIKGPTDWLQLILVAAVLFALILSIIMFASRPH